MAQLRINPAVVREELMKIMNDSVCWEFEGKDAERFTAYTAGAVDLANALIERYEIGEKNHGTK